MNNLAAKLSRLFESSNEAYEHRVNVIATNAQRVILESFITAPVSPDVTAEQLLVAIYENSYLSHQLATASVEITQTQREAYLRQINDALGDAVLKIHEIYEKRQDRHAPEFCESVATALGIPLDEQPDETG